MSIEDIFKVDDRRATGIWLQDSERPPEGTRDTFAVTNDLDRDIGPLRHLYEMVTLSLHNLGTAHNPEHCCLIDDGPQPVVIQPEWRHAGSVAGFGAWVPVRHASACGWPDLPGSGAWCVRVVVYGGAVAGGSQGWPVNSRVRASSASMPHLPAVDR